MLMRLMFILISLGAIDLFSGGSTALGQEKEHFDWNAMIRTRMQGDYQNGNNAANRFMYGFSLNGTLRVTDRINVTGRLKSGDSREITSSGWIEYSDLAIQSPSLAWMYVRLRLNPSLTLIAGKHPLPFFRPTQLVMDKDLSPEGFGQQILLNNDKKSASLGLNFGQFMINRLVSPVKDLNRTYLLGAQAVARFTQPSSSQALAIAYYTVGAADSIYAVQNLKSSPMIIAANSNRPNTNHSGYLSKFRMINVSAQYIKNLNGWPLTLNADYVFNTGADNMRQGIRASVAYGSKGIVGGTQAGIDIFSLEQDATFAPFSNVDYSQTNTKGIGFLVGRQLVEKISVDIALYTRKYNSPATLVSAMAKNTWRTRFRLVFKIQLN